MTLTNVGGEGLARALAARQSGAEFVGEFAHVRVSIDNLEQHLKGQCPRGFPYIFLALQSALLRMGACAPQAPALRRSCSPSLFRVEVEGLRVKG